MKVGQQNAAVFHRFQAFSENVGTCQLIWMEAYIKEHEPVGWCITELASVQYRTMAPGRFTLPLTWSSIFVCLEIKQRVFWTPWRRTEDTILGEKYVMAQSADKSKMQSHICSLWGLLEMNYKDQVDCLFCNLWRGPAPVRQTGETEGASGIKCLLHRAGSFSLSTPTEHARPYKNNDSDSPPQKHNVTFSFKLWSGTPTQT